MKILNDPLIAAGLYMPPLLKLINEYAWQTYLEHDLGLIIEPLRQTADYYGSWKMTPRLLLATILGTRDDRHSICFRRVKRGDIHLDFIYNCLKKWNLELFSGHSDINRKERIALLYLHVSTNKSMFPSINLEHWKIFCLVDELNPPQDMDMYRSFLTRCKHVVRIS